MVTFCQLLIALYMFFNYFFIIKKYSLKYTRVVHISTHFTFSPNVVSLSKEERKSH